MTIISDNDSQCQREKEGRFSQQALDNESERLVQEALNRLMAGKTTLIIAHRLSTVQHADQIIVIENGTIADRGEHEELLQSKGLYYNFTIAIYRQLHKLKLL